MIIFMSDVKAIAFIHKWCALSELDPSYTKYTKPLKILSRNKDKTWTAIDNTSYDCWVEEFPTFKEALFYLLGKEDK